MKKSTFWIMIGVIAAAVAAITTVTILVVRARQKGANIVEPVYDCGSCDELEEAVVDSAE